MRINVGTKINSCCAMIAVRNDRLRGFPMQIIEKGINELIPYTNNPRKNDGAVSYVAESIRQFGFKVPCVIDRNNVVIAGHTRLKAAQELGMDTVPCIVADDLTDEQVKAFRLADNKVSEMAEWDNDLLNIELDDILDIDMSDFGFPEDEPGEDDGYYGDERERTFSAYNLEEVDLDRVAGKWDMPVLTKTSYVPTDLISFNYLLTSRDYDKGIHFFIDDYQFERIWNQPQLYIEKIERFACALTPDFSTYSDMPLAMQLWNVYRSRLIGQMMQDAGIQVIPTLQWADERSFDFAFDGLPEGGTVAVSTIGVKRNRECAAMFTAGMDIAMERLAPKTIICYGGDVGYDFGSAKAVYISNHNAERMSNGRTRSE